MKEYGGAAPRISTTALQALQQYDFPGNIRELENVLERAFTLCEGAEIQPHDLQLSDAPGYAPTDASTENEQAPASGTTRAEESTPAASTQPRQESNEMSLPPGVSLEEYLENIERTLITQALEATRWNKTAAAKQLGITFRALRYKLKKLEME